MSNAYIVDAVSERVSNDICAVNPINYDLQDVGLSNDANLDTLITDLMVPVFFQYCINRNFGTDNELEIKEAIKVYINYMHNLLLDELIPNYDPEEDLG
jgi:hypothetical protein